MTQITLSTDGLHVTILQRGATLADVRFRPEGRNLLLGFTDPQDHARIPIYAGALVGPVANRVSHGHVRLDGTDHQMMLNESNVTALHSGPEGLHAHDWRIDAQTDTRVVLKTILQDGACGLPGHRDVTAIYELLDTTIRLEITATTDRATPMNIAAHPYWNLDGQADVSGHSLQVHAANYTPTDTQNIPTGLIAPCKGTVFDFEHPKQVFLDPALDLNFCLADAARETPHPAATLTGACGTQLDIATTAPGLQIYNGAFLPDLPGILSDTRDLSPYGGIALEPQFWPDAPNIPDFPQITLQPDDVWRQITTFQLTPAATISPA